MTEPRIEVHEDTAALATAAAGELVHRLADAQARGETPHVCLTGGSVADAIHHEVARLAAGAEVDWSQVVFWWGDERFVGAGSPERNAGQARSAFLDEVGVDPAQVHEIPAVDAAESVDAAAAAYSSEVRDDGSGEFDVVLLGVGADGHVASLFPGRPELDVDDRITVAVTDSPKPPPQRVSLTLPALNRSRSVWFVVSGADKADAVARALGGADLHDVPAAGVIGRTETIWFLDRASASAL